MRVKEMDELVLVWVEYAKCRDSKLTQDAIEFKRRIRKYVEKLPALKEITKQVFGVEVENKKKEP
jgi:hypothetical protein